MLENQINLANQKANLLTVANAGQMTLFGFIWTEATFTTLAAQCGLAAATLAFLYSIWASSPFDLGLYLMKWRIERPSRKPTPFFFADLFKAKQADGTNALAAGLKEMIREGKTEDLLDQLFIDIEAKAEWAHTSFSQLTRVVLCTLSPAVIAIAVWVVSKCLGS